MINGFPSEKIDIRRGVKQGDALSCALFIISIDPLIRNINKNCKVKKINIRKLNFEIGYKAAAFADDISVICKNTRDSIQQVFNKYERLTIRSGLELNADKTEFLLLNNDVTETIKFKYQGKNFHVQTVESIKICGLVYGIVNKDEYKNNVMDKITKLSYKLKLWSNRHLTMEGKILLTKTFGLSQLIYNMQSYGFEKADLVWAERIIFGFIWSAGSDKPGIDRIKRAILKNEYKEGGLKVTDVECLDKSLKLRQYVRSLSSNHCISKIQLLSQNFNISCREFSKITKDEPICQKAQETINMITDYNRSNYEQIPDIEDDVNLDKYIVDDVASINLSTYLERKNKVFHICILKSFAELGITTLHELIQELEFELDCNKAKAMKIVLSAFPKYLKQIAEKFNKNSHNDNGKLSYLKINESNWKELGTITTKELQIILKQILNRVESSDYKQKLGLTNFDHDNFINFRLVCKIPRLRNVYFRLFHNDFFTRERMKRYKMINSDECLWCGEIESTNHLLWGCTHAAKIWQIFNELLVKVNQVNDLVLSYDDVYKVSKSPEIALVKIRVIQAMIQIERPQSWSNENLSVLVRDILNTERYNNNRIGKMEYFKKRWSNLISWSENCSLIIPH
jgi:hypothetical protein